MNSAAVAVIKAVAIRERAIDELSAAAMFPSSELVCSPCSPPAADFGTHAADAASVAWRLTSNRLHIVRMLGILGIDRVNQTNSPTSWESQVL